MAARRRETGEPKDASISTEVNACLWLADLPNFQAEEGDERRITILMVGARSPAFEFLAKRAKSSPKEYKKLTNLLRALAEQREIPGLETIKRVGTKGRLLQLDGNKNARFYCFEEGATTVVCASGFWIGSGDKLKHQNEEIHAAERLMERWREAEPVPGYVDTRREK